MGKRGPKPRPDARRGFLVLRVNDAERASIDALAAHWNVNPSDAARRLWASALLLTGVGSSGAAQHVNQVNR